MAKFGKKSLELLKELHPDLQSILNDVILIVDFTILCGYRGKEDQEKAFKEGKSNAHFGQSKHNFKPSLAVDIAPYPIDWNDIDRFRDLAIVMKDVAKHKNIKLVWGGDFLSLKDYPHYELKV